MVLKQDVILGFVPEETKLENWLDEQLKNPVNIYHLTVHKFVVLAYADMPSDFGNERESEYLVTKNFVTKVVEKYNTIGNWKISYEYNRQHNFVVFVIR